MLTKEGPRLVLWSTWWEDPHQMAIPLVKVLAWVPPKSELEARIWMQVAYVGSNARKHSEGEGGEMRKGAGPVESIFMNWSQLWATGPFHWDLGLFDTTHFRIAHKVWRSCPSLAESHSWDTNFWLALTWARTHSWPEISSGKHRKPLLCAGPICPGHPGWANRPWARPDSICFTS